MTTKHNTCPSHNEPAFEVAGDGLEARAACLVNPASGVANDYLNHFNEILLLIENLPTLLPEMLDELLAWKPVSYREYFTRSLLPGSAGALQIYDRLDSAFRREFESTIADVDAMARKCVDVIGSHRNPAGEIDPEQVAEFCESASKAIRGTLNRAADLVNHGRTSPRETAQIMADRILTCSNQA